MNVNLDKIAKELYGKIQTRFDNIEFGDEEGTILSKKADIPKARFFEFEYKENGEILGNIAITLDEEDGIIIQVGDDLVDEENSIHPHAYEFIKSFRKFAKNRLLNFDVQNIGKSELDKRDYEFQAKPKENNIMENKLFGTARMSYQDLGEARLVVKHSQPINPELAAGRTMHIESIYIENAAGERFRYPHKHLSGARALAEHIKHGGNPYDAIGQHICNLSEELASLRKFKGYVSRQDQISEAMGTVTGRVVDRIEEIKETIAKLQKTAYYEQFAESFEAQEERIIPEEVANDLINRLTIKSFNEDLKAVFPYIYKFVDEAQLEVVELNADDVLSELSKDTLKSYFGKAAQSKAKANTRQARGWQMAHGGDQNDYDNAQDNSDEQQQIIDKRKAGMKQAHAKYHAEDQFESFLDSIVEDGMDMGVSDDTGTDSLFSDDPDTRKDAIERFNNEVLSAPIPAGQDGQTAIDTLKGFIDDPRFLDEFKDLDPNLDVRSMVQDYVQNRNADVGSQLTFGQEEIGGENLPEPAPAEPAPTPATPPPAPTPATPPPAPTPATPPPAPVAEGIRAAIVRAKNAGATLETQLDFGHGVKTLAEVIAECNCTPDEFGYEQEEVNPEEAMKEYVEGFFDPKAGHFPLGIERIKIKLTKAAEDGEFGSVDPTMLEQMLHHIEEMDGSATEKNGILKLAGLLKQAHQEKHGDAPVFMENNTKVAYSEEPTLARLISLIGR
jgi:hypothetical protein